MVDDPFKPAPAASCVACFADLPDKRAEICAACNSPQRGLARWRARRAGWVGAVGSILSALVIPISLLLATHYFADRTDRAKERARQYDEMVSTQASLRAAVSALYEPCTGFVVDKCLEQVDKEISGYLRASTNYQLAIQRNHPSLTSTAMLLRSLDHTVAIEVHSVWEEFAACARRYDAYDCIQVRRQAAYPSVQAADYILEYLGCAIESEQNQRDSQKVSTLCTAVLAERGDLLFDLPWRADSLYYVRTDNSQDPLAAGKRYREEIGAVGERVRNLLFPDSGSDSRADSLAG